MKKFPKVYVYGLVAIFQLCLVSNIAYAQINSALSEVLQTKLNSIRTSNRLKGISATVYIPGKGTWSGVTGVSYSTVKIDTNMLFSIGSVTKTFIAAEILKLAETGKLSLNDSIQKYVKSNPQINPNITISQLLSHTSGLGEITNTKFNDAMAMDYTKRWEAQAVIDSFLPAPAFQPGKSWSYCNSNYILLGLIAEKVGQDSLHRLLRKDFLSPLKMDNTFMHMMESFKNTIPHNWSAPNMDPLLASDASGVPHEALWTSLAAAGGIFSSPKDIAHWAYQLYSGKVLDSTSLKKMLSFRSAGGGYFNGYGLGAMRFVRNGETYWGHAGNFFGYAASMLFHTKDSICVAMLINQDCISPPFAEDLMEELLANKDVSSIEPADNILSFSLSPNPSQGELKIEMYLSTPAPVNMDIYNLVGELCYTTSLNAPARGQQQWNLTLPSLKTGLYMCKLRSAQGIKVEKLMIEN